MPPVGFEPTVSAGEGPKTYALDRAATGTGGKVTAVFFYLPIGYLTILYQTQELCILLGLLDP